MRTHLLAIIGLLLVSAAPPARCRQARGGESDELRVKREAVFEFAEKPKVARAGDRVTITFESKGFCDATVAIENAEGRIIRHLACGVLGPNAPAPFQKDSKKQTVLWDGKDDEGSYVDEKDSHTVRVSLGLKPQFERTLFWSPKKRISPRMPLVQAASEGVYVYDGDVVDNVRLFDHQGQYVRTVYPFPADRLKSVGGLNRQTFPQDGEALPRKVGFFQATFLTSGPNSGPQHADGHPGQAARAMAVRKDRIALADQRLNRLATDGSSGGLALNGPRTSLAVKPNWAREPIEVTPTSLAFSPDGSQLYLAGYPIKQAQSYLAMFYTVPAVLRMNYAGEGAPELFAGSLKPEERGSDAAHFNVPASVACDDQGRVYVADFANDRVQILAPDGKHLKTVPTPKPASVCLHHKTQELYIFSWAVPDFQVVGQSIEATLTRFQPFPGCEQIDSSALPIPYYEPTITTWYGGSHLGYGWGQPVQVTLDSWVDPPVIWLAREYRSGNRDTGFRAQPWQDMGIRLLSRVDGRLKEIGNFGDEAVKVVARVRPPVFHRQRLGVNPKDAMLYVAEGRGFCKSFEELIKINPETGKSEPVTVPFSAEDFAFDPNGNIYLRTNDKMVRYDAVTWREVPFDYGEQWPKVGYTADGMGLKCAPVVSALRMPAPAGWHHGGMWISPKGHIAVSCYNKTPARNRTDEKTVAEQTGSTGYLPPLYPGRTRTGEIHVWDEHGKLVHEDAVPGLGILNGVAIDSSDNLYVLEARNRVLDGKPYLNNMAGTLVKFQPRKAKVLSTKGTPIPLAEESKPKRACDFANGPSGEGWAQGAEWMYGGVGFGGKNPGTGCACWNCRFVLDYFGRSFAPEVDHYSVAVLDTSGNLILRVGRYGNVDDGKPLVAAGGPPNTRSVGGDEVSLMHACFVGTHTDHRLFIADAGNERILSVKLGYHAEGKVALKDVPDLGPK